MRELHLGQNMKPLERRKERAIKRLCGTSELRVIVVPERALHETLDRTFLGLAAHRGMSRRGFRAFFLLVVLGLLSRVCGPAVHAGALFFFPGVGNPVGPRGHELLGLVVLGIVVGVAAMGSRGAPASNLVGFGREFAV
jgi:hypothetical protein